MTVIKDILKVLESFAPLELQESYDNSGLLTGNKDEIVKGVLVSLDCTEEVVREAIRKKCNLIVSHHPLIFSPITRITGSNHVQRSLILALKNNIALYAWHTNLDSVISGVSGVMAKKIGLENVSVLKPKKGNLSKLVTFCPVDKAKVVRKALFESGAGHIGQYDHCSFSVSGEGSFRAGKSSNPYVGVRGKDHFEPELRIETIFRRSDRDQLISALINAHPYEEVAYDIYPLDNPDSGAGLGVIGDLKKSLDLKTFLAKLKSTFKIPVIRYSAPLRKKIKKVALCGGSGSFLLEEAISGNADILVTADVKYHRFFDAEGQIVLADIGHYESERFTPEIAVKLLKENFPNFATHFSSVNTNPVTYF